MVRKPNDQCESSKLQSGARLPDGHSSEIPHEADDHP